MEPITLIVTYTTKPGAAQAFYEALAGSGLPEQVRREEGCLRYDYFLPAQGGDTLLLLEGWRSPQAQQAHLAQPHMAPLQALKAQYVLDTAVETLIPQKG